MDAQIVTFERAIEHGVLPTVEDVVLGLLTPVLRLYVQVRYGQDAIKVLARLVHEPIADFPSAITASVHRLSKRAQAIFARLLPDKPSGHLELHLQHAVMATVNGLAVQQQFVSGNPTRWGNGSPADIFLAYASYVAAGIAGRPIDLAPGAHSAWVSAIEGDHPPGTL